MLTPYLKDRGFHKSFGDDFPSIITSRLSGRCSEKITACLEGAMLTVEEQIYAVPQAYREQ